MRSTERHTIFQNQQPPSAIKRTRSVTPSKYAVPPTPCTPMNLRSTISNSQLLSTNDKRGPIDDREAMTRMDARVFNYLINSGVLSGKDTVKNLKSMSYKQFLAAMAHLLGSVLHSTTAAENIDEIHKQLTQLECPFTINKSWLKTPTANHAFNHILITMNWLLNFIEPESVTETVLIVPDIDYHLEPGFTNVAFQSQFFDSAGSVFQFWDKGDDAQFENVVQEQADCLVNNKSHGKFKNISEVALALEKLTTEYETLEAKVKPTVESEKLQNKETSIKDLKKKIKSLDIVISGSEAESQILKNRIKDIKETQSQKMSEIEKLECQIKSQVMTVEEKQKIMESNFLLQIEINELQKNLNKVKAEQEACFIERARLINLKTQKINDVYNLMYKLIPFIKTIPEGQDIIESPLLESKDLNAVEELFKLANKLKSASKIVIGQMRQERKELTAELEKLKAAQEKRQQKVSKETEKTLLLQKRLREKKRELAEIENKLKAVNDQISNIEKGIQVMVAEIKENEEANATVERHNQELMTKYADEFKKNNDEQREKNNRDREKVKELEKEVRELEQKKAEKLEALRNKLKK